TTDPRCRQDRRSRSAADRRRGSARGRQGVACAVSWVGRVAPRTAIGKRPVRVYLGVMLRIVGPAILAMLAPLAATAGDCVVLLHGLARTDASLAVMAAALQAQGYRVVS